MNSDIVTMLLKVKICYNHCISILIILMEFMFVSCASTKMQDSYIGEYTSNHNKEQYFLKLYDDSTCYLIYKYPFFNISNDNYGKWSDKGKYIETHFVELDYDKHLQRGLAVHGKLVFEKDKNKLHFKKDKSKWGDINDFTIKKVKKYDGQINKITLQKAEIESNITRITLSTIGEERRLSKRCASVDIEKKEWFFSFVEETESAPFYKVYGDSLVTEMLEGHRQWYGLNKGSATYLGEETKRFKVMLDYPVPTYVFSKSDSESSDKYLPIGHPRKLVLFGMSGIYESYIPETGYIYTTEGEKIVAKAVTERRISSSRLLSDTIPVGIVPSREDITTRWFAEGDMLPIAMQRSSSVLENGRRVSTETVTYIADLEEFLK